MGLPFSLPLIRRLELAKLLLLLTFGYSVLQIIFQFKESFVFQLAQRISVVVPSQNCWKQVQLVVIFWGSSDSHWDSMESTAFSPRLSSGGLKSTCIYPKSSTMYRYEFHAFQSGHKSRRTGFTAKRKKNFTTFMAYVGRHSYSYNNNSNNNKMFYKRMGSCLVVPPPRNKKPTAIIEFLGGAFIGAVPEATYRYIQFSFIHI